jgi:hypothetical protein
MKISRIVPHLIFIELWSKYSSSYIPEMQHHSCHSHKVMCSNRLAHFCNGGSAGMGGYSLKKMSYSGRLNRTSKEDAVNRQTNVRGLRWIQLQSFRTFCRTNGGSCFIVSWPQTAKKKYILHYHQLHVCSDTSLKFLFTWLKTVQNTELTRIQQT